jgi:hypothetical protein
MVGFLFLDTRLLGVAVPGDRDFAEVNLRCYERRRVDGESRRGVTFLSEIVARRAIALTAWAVFNEPYRTLPMRHRVVEATCENAWKHGGRWHSLGAVMDGAVRPMAPGSEEEFTFKHYWGYTAQRDGGTVESAVEHPRWQVAPAARWWFDCDVAALYGPQFVAALGARPRSVFVAEGSEVTVRSAVRIA